MTTLLSRLAWVLRKNRRKFVKVRELADWVNESGCGGAVLDVGAGYTPLYDFLDEKKGYTALEGDARAVRKLHEAGVRAVAADLNEKLPFKDKTFSCVVLSDCLYCTRNPFGLLAECRRVLKENGLVIGSALDPSCGPLKPQAGKFGRAFYCFNKVTLYNLLEESGFKTLEMKRFILPRVNLPVYTRFGAYLFFKARKK